MARNRNPYKALENEPVLRTAFHVLGKSPEFSEAVIRYDGGSITVVWPEGRAWRLVCRELVGAERPEPFIFDEG